VAYVRTAIAAACVCGLFSLAAGASLAASAETHTVLIQGLKFIPQTLTVKRGDTIVWINKDPFPHTATAKGLFDSGSLGPGESWTHKAVSPGEHAYLCTLHPNMKGTLRVQ
jgi:plastocyanin